jgi:hypothetical protein
MIPKKCCAVVALLQAGILGIYLSSAFLLHFFADDFNLAKVADYSG